jgi:hypothetical protein
MPCEICAALTACDCLAATERAASDMRPSIVTISRVEYRASTPPAGAFVSAGCSSTNVGDAMTAANRDWKSE